MIIFLLFVLLLALLFNEDVKLAVWDFAPHHDRSGRLLWANDPEPSSEQPPGKRSDEWDRLWICEGTDFVRFHNLLGITISHVDKE